MKLARYRHPNGSTGVGMIHDFTLTPLNLAGRQYNSLADVLEADNPAEVADFLTRDVEQVRFHILPRVRFIRHTPPEVSKEVVAAGRPTCAMCGEPIDPEGHFCPRRNGHRT